MQSTAAHFSQQRHIYLNGISWATYQSLFRELQECTTRMTFSKGDLEIFAPIAIHERWKCKIRSMVDFASLDRSIEIEGLGSTTLSREDLQIGLEPDECFYVANAQKIRGKHDLDLSIDPPPDLVIELALVRRSIKREPILAAHGVPEVWRFDGANLTCLTLVDGGTYALVSGSPTFPFLRMDEFQRFLLRFGDESWLDIMKDFRVWVQSL